MIQKQFDDLIRKLESFSAKHPRSYRLRVALLALLGYIYIIFILLGLLGFIATTIFLMFYSRRVNGYAIKFLFLLLIPIAAILKALWIQIPPPQGILLTRSEVPRLFSFIDTLTNKLQAPRFHEILLDNQANASVVQIPRLGILGWQQNYLVLGLPLMQMLSVEEFKAVLSHELGHLSRNHSRFSGRIYRVRQTWKQVYDNLYRDEKYGQSILFLFNWFFRWYFPFFNAYSFVLRRLNEYEADNCAVKATGKALVAQALINMEIKAKFLEDCYWDSIYKKVEHQACPPQQVYTTMFAALNQPIPVQQKIQWLTQVLEQETNKENTHPCLTDRLKALGYSKDRAFQLLNNSSKSANAAKSLLGNNLDLLTTKCNEEWYAKISTWWQQRYTYKKEVQQKLEKLENKFKNKNLTDREAWEYACFTLETQGEEDAIPLMRSVLKSNPNYQQAEVYYQLLANAQYERASVSQYNILKPHTFKQSEVTALIQKLIDYLQIKEIYLAEKVMNYFPEDRFAVVGLVRKQNFIESSDASQKLIDRIIEEIEFPNYADFYILTINENRWFKKKISQFKNSLIWKR